MLDDLIGRKTCNGCGGHTVAIPTTRLIANNFNEIFYNKYAQTTDTLLGKNQASRTLNDDYIAEFRLLEYTLITEEKKNDATVVEKSDGVITDKNVEEESIKKTSSQDDDKGDKELITITSSSTSNSGATAAKKNATVEDEEDSDDEDDIPELAEEQGLLPDVSSLNLDTQSRGEKKARKAMQKLGLVHVPGITRVTIKRAKNMLFVVSNADVYKSSNSDCYIVFGEAKVEDLNSQAQANAAQQFQNAAETTTSAIASKETAKVEETNEEDSIPIDETNVEAKDIELVMQHTNCSRAKAVKALKNNNSDIVNAIMELQ
ncbi:6402_t:CDS:2 [Entrophospora sp. SA101]|nr:656_t:CDS:2 [Entrophospora sp. SA101]CAJ0759334.1 6402_t:CDS:2 [Entrophospora sp. SA101]CAJ0879244.1 19327_t:CDS:2 [Entrophospora sp. SA101]CAJ0906799.1 8999_t:CDS:2 [Entrophospora sp. SA101]